MKKTIKSLEILMFSLLFVFATTMTAFGQEVVNPNNSAKTSSVSQMLDKMDSDMNKAGVANYLDSRSVTSNSVSILSSTSVPIGTNQIFYSANAGNSGSSGSGVGTHGEGFSAIASIPWADSGTYLAGTGNIGSWAWVGEQIAVTGSGSRSATIYFSGDYNGCIIGSSGYSSAKIRVSVIDLGSSMEVGSTIIEPTVTTGTHNYSADISRSITTTLQSGHSYALRFGVSTASNLSGVGQIQSAFCNIDTWGQWDPDAGEEGVQYSYISLTWN